MATVSEVKGATWTPFTSVTVAAGACLLDAVGFDNRTAGMTAIDLRLNVTSVTPTAGGTIQLYLSSKIDGTNYPVPGASAALPPASSAIGTPYVFTGSATTIIDLQNLPMMAPYLNELILFNNSSASITINTSLAQSKTIQIA